MLQGEFTLKVRDWFEFGNAFILPAILILGCLGLLYSGKDGEVKAILAVAAGWLFKSVSVRIIP
jgi:hypothetical protein